VTSSRLLGTVRMKERGRVGPGTRRVVAVVLGGILLVAMVIGVVFIIRAVTAPPLMPAGPSIARIDVGRATFDTAIAVHGQPSQMAIGDSIWIIDDSSHTLLRVDLNTGELLHSSPVDGTPTGIAFGDGSVWVSSGPTGSVIRFDARTGDRQRSIRVPSGVSGMAYGAGSLWVADPLHDRVLRIDPVTNSVVATRSVGREPEVVAVGAGGVCVLNALDNSLSRIDPASNVVSPPIALQATATAVAVSADAIWLASTPGSITRIDPRTSQTVETLVVGGGPVAIAVAGGAVWVANYAASEVERIDLVSYTVTSHLNVPAPPAPLPWRLVTIPSGWWCLFERGDTHTTPSNSGVLDGHVVERRSDHRLVIRVRHHSMRHYLHVILFDERHICDQFFGHVLIELRPAASAEAGKKSETTGKAVFDVGNLDIAVTPGAQLIARRAHQ